MSSCMDCNVSILIDLIEQMIGGKIEPLPPSHAQMREAIQHHHDPACQQMQGPYGEQWRNTSEVCTCWVSDALALPIDDTALRAQLKEERERCARYCEGTFELGGDALNCAAGTRNLGDE